MWKRLLWQYSQWKLLYFPLSHGFQWILRGILEEWLFSYLAEYAKNRVGFVVDIIHWIEIHPMLTSGIVIIIIGLIITILAIREAKKRIYRLYELEDNLLDMFKIAIKVAGDKANNIKYDEKYDSMMKRIAQDIFNIDPKEYAGKNLKDNKEIAKMEKQIRKQIPTDEDTVPYFKLIASALVNNSYGITGKLEQDKTYNNLKNRIETLRKVPSDTISKAVIKCLDYIYILSHNYIHHIVRLNNPSGVGEQTLAQLRNFVLEQDNNTGNMSECLTALRIEIDNYVKGGRDGK